VERAPRSQTGCGKRVTGNRKATTHYRNLGASGLMVPALSFGAGTLGGEGPLFSAWGSSSVEEARRLIDICLNAGVSHAIAGGRS
jgi:hypothetical protein